MALVAYISDIHFGVKADSPVILQHQIDFFNKVFFPEIKRRNIKHIVMFGDLFDKRQIINYKTLDAFNKCFLKHIIKNKYKLDLIIGNHDTVFRDSNELNSISALNLGMYDNVTVYYKNTIIDFYGKRVAIIPWIYTGSEQDAISFIHSVDVEYIFGHFEVYDYDNHTFHDNDEQVCLKHLSKFNKVFSGHDHLKYVHENYISFGAPFQYTFGDAGKPKGFYIFDTEEDYLEFFENPIEIFVKIYNIDSIDVVDLKDKFVKVMRSNEIDPEVLLKITKEIERKFPAKLEFDNHIDTVVQDEVDIKYDNMQTLIQTCVAELKIDNVVKDDVAKLLNNIYIKSEERRFL